MKKIILSILFIPMLLLSSSFHNEKQIADISSSVVKIYTNSVSYTYLMPWTKFLSSASTGTGVIIDNNLILTAAHVVTDGVLIQVKKSNDSKKYIAKVKWISHDADLALLEVEDKSFFKNTIPQKLDGLPNKQDGVVVYGYPVGGDELSTTKGIVSRIEDGKYAHSDQNNLIIQIDASINSGNSGGPAFNKDGKIVGIAIQSIEDADNIGYVVPTEIINHFFEDIKDGHYDGFPSDGLFVQELENKNIKEFYNLGDRDGVLVYKILKNSSSDGYIKKGDIILEIDDINIAGNNKLSLNGKGSISSNYLVKKHQVGDKLKVKILRDKKEMIVYIPLKKNNSVIKLIHEEKPKYFVYGGIVFMPLTMNALTVWNAENAKWEEKAPKNLLYFALDQSLIDDDIEELVIIDNVLSNEENINYEYNNKVVSTVNGEKITSFKHVVKVLKESKEKYLKITLANGKTIILDREKALKIDKRTVEDYGYPSVESL